MTNSASAEKRKTREEKAGVNEMKISVNKACL